MKFSDAEIQTYFNKILYDDKNISAGIAAIMTLLEVLQRDDATTTITELRANFVEAINAMKKCDQPTTSVSSGCALFLRFITLVEGLDAVSFAKCKEIMADRGKLFLGRLHEARGKVAQQASSFISDGCKILTHSKSRVVLETIRQAVQHHKRFKVYVTTSSPDNAGIEMYEILCKEGVDCTLILDSSVGYILEQVDLVMFGAEGVAESGGIINKIGTYTIAMCAKELKKPVYVLTESFKFNRVYPLNQKDLPNEFKYLSSTLNMKDFSKEHPLVDYTPPSYITLLFTDIGILTPSAVSDELIKLYL